MPVAAALRNALSGGLDRRMRPTGSPRKMVEPAIAPRSEDLCRRQCRLSLQSVL